MCCPCFENRSHVGRKLLLTKIQTNPRLHGAIGVITIQILDSTTFTCNFQQCGILTSVDSDEHVQPLLSLETPNGVQLEA